MSERADPRDDPGRAEDNEHTDDYSRAKAPIHPPSQHHKADGGNCHHRKSGRNRSEQNALHPDQRVNDRAGSLRARCGLRMRNAWQKQGGQKRAEPSWKAERRHKVVVHILSHNVCVLSHPSYQRANGREWLASRPMTEAT